MMVLSLKAQLLKAQQQQTMPAEIQQQTCIMLCALVDSDGYPWKGQKSVFKKLLSGRYPAILSSSPPSSFLCHKANTVVVLDGMFFLQSSPLSHHKLLIDYVFFLLSRWLMPMFAYGDHVHLVLDHA